MRRFFTGTCLHLLLIFLSRFVKLVDVLIGNSATKLRMAVREETKNLVMSVSDPPQ